MTMNGPAVLDIVQHFVERWNEVKKRKVSNYVPHARPYADNFRNQYRHDSFVLHLFSK